jgi:hypothetical protein
MESTMVPGGFQGRQSYRTKHWACCRNGAAFLRCSRAARAGGQNITNCSLFRQNKQASSSATTLLLTVLDAIHHPSRISHKPGRAQGQPFVEFAYGGSLHCPKTGCCAQTFECVTSGRRCAFVELEVRCRMHYILVSCIV